VSIIIIPVIEKWQHGAFSLPAYSIWTHKVTNDILPTLSETLLPFGHQHVLQHIVRITTFPLTNGALMAFTTGYVYGIKAGYDCETNKSNASAHNWDSAK